MRKSLAILGLAALTGACAGAQEFQPVDGLGEVEGSWMVTDSFGQPAHPSPVGQRLRLTAGEAQDLSGRLCAEPRYRRGELTEAAFLGIAADNPALARPVPILEVTCRDEAFGRYAYWKEGSLLAAEGGRVYRLTKWDGAARLPSPATPEAANPAAAPVGAAPPPARAEGGQSVYLASYRDAAGAARGWEQLAARQPLLRGLTAVQRPVTLPGKGRFIRLYAEGADAGQAREVCRSLTALLPDCGARRSE